MIADFHTHTFLSDGINSPIELIRCAVANGYSIIGITDHVSYSNIDYVVEAVKRDCKLAERFWNIKAIPGVELTNIPPDSINELAKYAKESGANYVVVHGESIYEKVEAKTNYNALNSNHVDILAHPGLITSQEAKEAAKRGIFLEITSRLGHCLTNGHVVKIGKSEGAKFLINSDSHSHKDLYFEDMQVKVAKGAGLNEGEIKDIFEINVKDLLKKLDIDY